MSLRFWLGCLFLLTGSVAQAEALSYQRDIQPIFTAKCVACHACYDSPCQLNLGSGEGVERGANKLPVYNGVRSKAQAPTRLFLDAEETDAWRRKGFHGVLDAQDTQAALMARMLELGRSQPLTPNAKLPAELNIGIGRENNCPLPEEFDGYARKNLHGGMPFAVTGLSDQEYATLQRWLEQGAPVEHRQLQPSPAEALQIEEWERLLNTPGPRGTLVGRWLYEHLFIAHLYFEDGERGHFYQLVRSRTPSGEPIDPITTRRPNDDPGTRFSYRLRPISDVIVHKTHITYPLSSTKLARVRSLFFEGNWVVESVPGYGANHRANPFKTFQAIPAEARYQFMLDNAEYFVRTFIRGPVCRGQIATDVIRDNFWVFFQDPQHDLYITDLRFREQATPLLAMPGQFDEMGDLLAFWKTYRVKRNQYEQLRTKAYADAPADWPQIWSGNDNALLSVFRQHDSASVRKGLIGEIPQTLWWMDYPLLERTYYQLVVNFDVFGNVSHQGQTRLYFDLIRNGAELNFLRLLPANSRQAILDDWYEKGGQLKLLLAYTAIDSSTSSLVALSKADPKRDFAQRLLVRHAAINAAPDPINRCQGTHCYREDQSVELQRVEQALARLTNRMAAGLPAILQLPEATLLRVEYADDRREIYSLLRNRAHSNVAFMFGESLRWQPRLDTLTVYPGILSSYPNFLFSLPASDVPAFAAAMEQVRNRGDFEQVVERWGIRRSHPLFWSYFNDLTRYLEQVEPLEAGVLDMNRYENL
ncbi:MAG: fatty acid cis/trans isomerase [Pseudomonas sp.]|uniref:fatty acid cis/trans isomerase n=1 Tax=Stutzerimonas frequens TaxID=2968969 RepID=UPI001268EE24|nr:fatty acid cis/trans isomerase [Stutzerimonas frequens]MBA4724702.1 fatty acid cis/trans isomerase [Pseudomonas sp.]MBK3916981.1 peptidylprolyl isomerase [Stutzerimonas frequens]MEC7472160.1 fatty acid cis/trans isomerase [Pseudomonadota bacterium]QFU12587.1 Fatty acid cis/trans isomerase (CTI) [Stutzerimonas frequens]|tara:strand:+ start:8733 stop:11009 length:2277 start_codon:yes stop_codon:yes gene_type:complete